MDKAKKLFIVFTLGVGCLSLGVSHAQAARHKRRKLHPDQSVEDASQSESALQPVAHGNSYVNIGQVGIGPTWDSMLTPSANASSLQMGSFDGRYWANRNFGFDAGFGFGLPEASPHSASLLSLRVEGMATIKETRHNIFYADMELVPVFLSASGGSQSAVTFQGGFGLEHAVSGISNLSLYTEWEPLSIDSYSPGGGQSSAVSFGFLGSVMNFTMGLRYYF